MRIQDLPTFTTVTTATSNTRESLDPINHNMELLAQPLPTVQPQVASTLPPYLLTRHHDRAHHGAGKTYIFVYP